MRSPSKFAPRREVMDKSCGWKNLWSSAKFFPEILNLFSRCRIPCHALTSQFSVLEFVLPVPPMMQLEQCTVFSSNQRTVQLHSRWMLKTARQRVHPTGCKWVVWRRATAEKKAKSLSAHVPLMRMRRGRFFGF